MWLLINLILTLMIIQSNRNKRSLPKALWGYIKIEVDKLFKAEFIKSVDYLMWLSNVILVKKANKQL